MRLKQASTALTLSLALLPILLSGAIAQEIAEANDFDSGISVIEPDAHIAISETAQPTANSIGVISPLQAGLSIDAWKGTDITTIASDLQRLPQGVASPALRSLVLRAISADVALPEVKADMLLVRTVTLIRLGQIKLAQKLLAQVPLGMRSDAQTELAFLLKAITDANVAESCGEAEARLSEKPSHHWQRWVVLCQTLTGETEKADLGLSLLHEQNQSPEFLEDLITYVKSGKPIHPLPKHYSLEQVAWLRLAKADTIWQNIDLSKDVRLLGLVTLQNPLLQGMWQEQITRYGIGMVEVPVAPKREFIPGTGALEITPDADSDQVARAFMAYAFRKAFKQPVPPELEQALLQQNVKQDKITLSAVWRERAQALAKSGQQGALILLAASQFDQPLDRYAADEIGELVRVLYDAGLEYDAYAVAAEAMGEAGTSSTLAPLRHKYAVPHRIKR